MSVFVGEGMPVLEKFLFHLIEMWGIMKLDLPGHYYFYITFRLKSFSVV